VSQSGKPPLPPIIVLHHPEAFDVWTLYRAFDRQFLPSQLLIEPESWLADMLALDSAFEALKPENDNG
jgi:hypothetical protein